MYFPLGKYMTGPRIATAPGQRPARAGRGVVRMIA